MEDDLNNSKPLLENTSDLDETEDENDNDVPKPADVHILQPPDDRHNINYMVFYLLGMTTLLPWNFFMTAEDYWMFKFRNCSDEHAAIMTPIQAQFTSDLSFASAFPNTIFLILNAFYGHKFPLQLRMIGALIVVFIFFIVTTALVMVDTDGWQWEFFLLTMATVVIMNIASAILSGGLFGLAGQFPSEYMTGVVSGQALGGIFAAICEIISLTFRMSPQFTALAYFMIGNMIMLLSIICYILMSRTTLFKFYTGRQNSRAVRPDECYESETICATPQFKTVLSKIWLHGFTEWLVFVVTLSVYPAVTVLVNSQHKGNTNLWNDVYFTPVINFLIFNTGDYLGRIYAGWYKRPRNKPELIALLTLLRVIFIPAILLCNAKPRYNLPVLIHSDIIYIAIICIFSFSNGYLANIALISAPKCVAVHEKEMASSTMAAFLGIGLAFGSALSIILVGVI